MLRRSWDDLNGKLLVTFKENFLNKGFDKYVKSFNGQTSTLTWNNGSQIVFMSESYNNDKELNRFRGLEINGGFCDEVNELQEITFDKVIERSGSWFHSPGCPVKILGSCNPTNNWVKKRFYDPWKKGILPKGIAYVQAYMTDNPYIPKEYLESVKLLPRYQYEVFVLGNWDIQLKTGGEFYKEFELDVNVRNTIYNPDLPLHISFDENVNPYLPCGIFQVINEDIRMVDEIAATSPNNNLQYVCREISNRYRNHKTGMFIYGDATSRKQDVKIEKGHNLFTLIENYLIQFKPILRVPLSNPSVVMRGQFMNMLLSGKIEGASLTIGDNCQFTINDFINTKEGASGEKHKEVQTNPTTKAREQITGHFTDLSDYAVCEILKEKYTKFVSGDTIPVFHFGKGNINTRVKY
jgi:hypothetical protein